MTLDLAIWDLMLLDHPKDDYGAGAWVFDGNDPVNPLKALTDCIPLKSDIDIVAWSALLSLNPKWALILVDLAWVGTLAYVEPLFYGPL